MYVATSSPTSVACTFILVQLPSCSFKFSIETNGKTGANSLISIKLIVAVVLSVNTLSISWSFTLNSLSASSIDVSSLSLQTTIAFPSKQNGPSVSSITIVMFSAFMSSSENVTLIITVPFVAVSLTSPI